MKLPMKLLKVFLFTLVLILSSQMITIAQVEAPLLIFKRGVVWHSLSYAKSGPTYNNWAQTGPGLDWPGFDISWINEDIGGSPSHLSTGGFWIGAKRSKDSVLTVEDWAMYAGSVANDVTAKYTIKTHRHLYKSGENNWLKLNPSTGEEVIESVWEYNPLFFQERGSESQLPVRVTRRAHVWSGSKKDENYIIYTFVIKNISDEIKQLYPTRTVSDTMYSTNLLFTYGIHVNSRSQRVLFPQESSGARNSKVNFDFANRMMIAESYDYGFSQSLGKVVNGTPSGEYLAPGTVGFKLLYSSPDSSGRASRVDLNRIGWTQADNSLDLSGPFTGVSGTLETRYSVVSNPKLAYRYVGFPNNLTDTTFMRSSRKWSLMSIGPWTLKPGDSIVLAYAEVMAGMDYKLAIDKNVTPTVIYNESFRRAFKNAYERAQFTYDNQLNHPDPPAAPEFKVDFFRGTDRQVANVITFGSETESLPDPDDGTLDLYGYKLYRSDFLPIGPWDSIATIYKNDPKFYDAGKGIYTFIDSSVQIGTGYYYALTAFDTGKASWPPNPAARFPETGSNRVPSLESSISANRMTQPFLATLPAKNNLNEVLVVPNPFVLGQGASQPGESDQIQFVNVPNPCTIRIYTVRGDLVKTIDVAETVGGIVTWNQITDFGQFVESGVYIFHVDSPVGTKIGKFAIVR